MNNPFENFDNWEEDMEENESFDIYHQNVVPTIKNNMLPRLRTTDTQIHQIGYHLGKHYPASVINRNITRNRIRIEANLDKAEEMMAQNRINEAELLSIRANKYANRLERWVEIAKNKRLERDTGVTRIHFPS